MSDFSGKGFAAGVVRGARAFYVDDDQMLTGIVYREQWKPGVNHSECFRYSDKHNLSNYSSQRLALLRKIHSGEIHLFEKCSCGFYAYYDGSNDYANDATISGVVEGYGEVVIGDRGFRARKTRIAAIHMKRPPHRAAKHSWRRHPYRRGIENMVERMHSTKSTTMAWPYFLAVFTLGLGVLPVIMQNKAFYIWLYETYGLEENKPKYKWYTPSVRAKGITYVPKETYEGVQKNYPGIPIYDDFDMMIADFPLGEQVVL